MGTRQSAILCVLLCVVQGFLAATAVLVPVALIIGVVVGILIKHYYRCHIIADSESTKVRVVRVFFVNECLMSLDDCGQAISIMFPADSIERTVSVISGSLEVSVTYSLRFELGDFLFPVN